MSERLTSEVEILVYFAVWTLVFKTQGRLKSELHRMTPNWTLTLNNQKYVIYTIYWPHTLKSWSRTSCFRDTRSSKIGNAPNDPKWTWTLNSQKYSTYRKYLTPEVQILIRFALWLAVSEIQGRQNQKFTEWPQTELEHLTINTTLYTLNTYPWGPKFAPFCSTTSIFEDIAHFIIPIDYHVKRPNKEKKMSKIQNFKFHNSLYNFGGDPPQEYTWILGSKSGVFFQRRCRLKLLPPCGPMLTKTKKKMAKIHNLKFHNSLNNSGTVPS